MVTPLPLIFKGTDIISWTKENHVFSHSTSTPQQQKSSLGHLHATLHLRLYSRAPWQQPDATQFGTKASYVLLCHLSKTSISSHTARSSQRQSKGGNREERKERTSRRYGERSPSGPETWHRSPAGTREQRPGAALPRCALSRERRDPAGRAAPPLRLYPRFAASVRSSSPASRAGRGDRRGVSTHSSRSAPGRGATGAELQPPPCLSAAARPALPAQDARVTADAALKRPNRHLPPGSARGGRLPRPRPRSPQRTAPAGGGADGHGGSGCGSGRVRAHRSARSGAGCTAPPRWRCCAEPKIRHDPERPHRSLTAAGTAAPLPPSLGGFPTALRPPRRAHSPPLRRLPAHCAAPRWTLDPKFC
ncbi:translation initiation factor IF-2 [Gallus gallus]|uniref:translation initiation factor IF-2 n=1 Tax=Gallus gallus TaxID=9031 RepID=UPI001AE86EBF|nr:translation initiation factor IF-2 [Gallus gallus]